MVETDSTLNSMDYYVDDDDDGDDDGIYRLLPGVKWKIWFPLIPSSQFKSLLKRQMIWPFHIYIFVYA